MVGNGNKLLLSPSPGNIFVGKGENTMGSRYKKAVYREYTDDTFRVQKKRPPSQQHLEIMGKWGCSVWCFNIDNDNGDAFIGFLFRCRSDN